MSSAAAKITHVTSLEDTKRQAKAEVESGPRQCRTVVEMAAPWPSSVNCVDCSIPVSNYHYFLDQHKVGKTS